MATRSVRIRYRPIRIGWCVRNNNLDDFRRALRLTHTLWGGKFNPVIPVGAVSAHSLVRQFRVDLLLSVQESSQIQTFVESFPYLQSPLLRMGLFESDGGRRGEPTFLDISHSLEHLADEVGKRKDSTDDELSLMPEANPYGLVHWTADDPLGDFLLATFGAYPPQPEIGWEYEHVIQESIKAACYVATPTEALPAYLLNQTMPSDISALDLYWDRAPSDASMGFYAGRADDFEDLVNYWNLRAADLNVLFLDPQHSDRLKHLRDYHLHFVQQRRTSTRSLPSGIHVWSRSLNVIQQLGFDPELVPNYFSIEGTAAIRGDVYPPLHYFKNRTVLASTSESFGETVLAIQLPDKPFENDEEFSQQHFIVSVKSFGDSDNEKRLWTPYIPELNHWFGRQLISSNSENIRVETDACGIVCQITEENLELSLINRQALVRRLFEFVGIDAQQSTPGRIASRLIGQLGGLQGCRVFKISGVRNLIKEYSPLKEFSRTAATKIIGNRNPATGQPNFSDYEDLWIEQRDAKKSKLTPEDAFLYLLDKGVFRVGLTLTCSSCELPYWVSLDEASAKMVCDLCGSQFNVTRQLKDRCWMYRRTGLFGSDNNQEGSIPVALTLLHLTTHLNPFFNGSTFTTNISLKPIAATIEPCEIDFFFALQAHNGIQVAFGECKDAGGAMTAEDARKLAKVADAFRALNFEPYIVFSKNCPLHGGGYRTLSVGTAEQPSVSGHHAIESSARVTRIS